MIVFWLGWQVLGFLSVVHVCQRPFFRRISFDCVTPSTDLHATLKGASQPRPHTPEQKHLLHQRKRRKVGGRTTKALRDVILDRDPSPNAVVEAVQEFGLGKPQMQQRRSCRLHRSSSAPPQRDEPGPTLRGLQEAPMEGLASVERVVGSCAAEGVGSARRRGFHSPALHGLRR
mmetsp:Transcript_4554/g.9140  ORF Transcript_4554/g.9140 Transcript_4554/m.9140 type:complete len:174 (+) Transcript_4554:86-607(+)